MTISRYPGFPRALLVSVLLAACDVCTAAIDEVAAGELTAAWIKNIATYTTWPEDKASTFQVETDKSLEQLPIFIGVVGGDPNGVVPSLRSRIESEKGLLAQGRRLQLIDLNSSVENPDRNGLVSLLETCDLLFFSEDGLSGWTRIRPIVELMPIVTVSEIEGFAGLGGVIEHNIDRRGRQSMVINLNAMKRAGVVLSANLLRLKTVIILREEEDAR